MVNKPLYKFVNLMIFYFTEINLVMIPRFNNDMDTAILLERSIYTKVNFPINNIINI